MRGRLGKTRRIAMVSFATVDSASAALSALHYATVTSQGEITKPPPQPAEVAEMTDVPLSRGETQSVIKAVLAIQEAEDSFATRAERQEAKKIEQVASHYQKMRMPIRCLAPIRPLMFTASIHSRSRIHPFTVAHSSIHPFTVAHSSIHPFTVAHPSIHPLTVAHSSIKSGRVSH